MGVMLECACGCGFWFWWGFPPCAPCAPPPNVDVPEHCALLPLVACPGCNMDTLQVVEESRRIRVGGSLIILDPEIYGRLGSLYRSSISL